MHRDQTTGQVWPALAVSTGEPATVLDPALLHADPSWADEVAPMGVVNTTAGACEALLGYRWLIPEPASTALRLLGSQIPA